MSLAKDAKSENSSSIVYFLNDNNYITYPNQNILNDSLNEAYGESTWQNYNPLNALEALTVIPARVADSFFLRELPADAAASQQDSSGRLFDDKNTTTVSIPPVTAKRKVLRTSVNAIMRLPHKLVQPITSPKKFFFEPLNQLRKQYPKWFAAVILSAVLMTIFIAICLSCSGLPAFMLAIGAAATHAGVAIAGVTWLSWLGATAAIVLVKLALALFTLLAGTKLLQALATEVTGLHQYRLEKLQGSRRLSVDNSTDSIDSQLSQNPENTEREEHEASENDPRLEPYIKIYEAILAVIKIVYPTFKDSILIKQNQAFTGYLLEQSFPELKLQARTEEEDFDQYILRQLADDSVNLPILDNIIVGLNSFLLKACQNNDLCFLTSLVRDSNSAIKQFLVAVERIVESIRCIKTSFTYDPKFMKIIFPESQAMSATSLTTEPESLSTRFVSANNLLMNTTINTENGEEARQGNSEMSAERGIDRKSNRRGSRASSSSKSRSREASTGNSDLSAAAASESEHKKKDKKGKKPKKGSRSRSNSESRSSRKGKSAHTKSSSIDSSQLPSQQETTVPEQSSGQIAPNPSSKSLPSIPRLPLNNIPAVDSTNTTTSLAQQETAGHEKKEKKPKSRNSFPAILNKAGSMLGLKSSSKDKKANNKPPRSQSLDTRKPLVPEDNKQEATEQEVNSRRKRSNSEPVALDYYFDQPPRYVAALREFISCEKEFSINMAALANLMKTYEIQLKEIEKNPNKRKKPRSKVFMLEKRVKTQAQKVKKEVISALSNLGEASKFSSTLLSKFGDLSRGKLFGSEANSSPDNVSSSVSDEGLNFVEKSFLRFNSLKRTPFETVGDWRNITQTNFKEKLDEINNIFNEGAFVSYFVAMTEIASDYENLIKLLANFAEENQSQLNEVHLGMLKGGKFAIMPVQRIMRYRIHIQDIREQYIKETNQDSEVLKELDEFIQFITGMANQSGGQLTGSLIRSANEERRSPRLRNPTANLLASSMTAGNILTSSAPDTSLSQAVNDEIARNDRTAVP